HGLADGPDHLRGVQGYRQSRDLSRARAGGPPHLPIVRRAPFGHAARGAALLRGRAQAHPAPPPRPRRPQAPRGDGGIARSPALDEDQRGVPEGSRLSPSEGGSAPLPKPPPEQRIAPAKAGARTTATSTRSSRARPP